MDKSRNIFDETDKLEDISFEDYNQDLIDNPLVYIDIQKSAVHSIQDLNRQYMLIDDYLDNVMTDSYHVRLNKDKEQIEIFLGEFFAKPKQSIMFLKMIQKCCYIKDIIVPSLKQTYWSGEQQNYKNFMLLCGHPYSEIQDFHARLVKEANKQKRKKQRTLDLRNFDISDTDIVDFGFIFSELHSNKGNKFDFFDYIDVTGWNISHLKCLSFRNMISVKKIIGIEELNTSGLVDMSSMFHTCLELRELDLSKWNVSKVNSMNRMFYSCEKLTSLNIDNWNTVSLNNMSEMFCGCKSLRELHINHFNVSRIQSLYRTFDECMMIRKLDLSNWKLWNCNIFRDTFTYCISLEEIKLPPCEIKPLVTGHMFYQCRELKRIHNIEYFDMSELRTCDEMFFGCNKLVPHDTSGWNLNQKQAIYVFYGSSLNTK